MRNSIHYINKTEYEKLNFCSNTKIAIVDCKTISNWNDYISVMSKELSFPKSEWDLNYAGYTDYMMDLDWCKEKSIAVIFMNYHSFLKNDIKLKEFIINKFQNRILPFWDDEVERVVVDGKKREFNVYCVD